MRSRLIAVGAGFLAGLVVFMLASLFIEAVLNGHSTIRQAKTEPNHSQLELHVKSGLDRVVRGLPTFGVGMSGVGALLALWVDLRRRRAMEHGNAVTLTVPEQPPFGPWPAETIGVVLVRGMCAAAFGAVICWLIQLGWAYYFFEPAAACGGACVVAGLVLRTTNLSNAAHGAPIKA